MLDQNFLIAARDLSWMPELVFERYRAGLVRKLESDYRKYLDSGKAIDLCIYLDTEAYNRRVFAIRDLDNWMRDGDHLIVNVFGLVFNWEMLGLDGRFPDLRAPWQCSEASKRQDGRN